MVQKVSFLSLKNFLFFFFFEKLKSSKMCKCNCVCTSQCGNFRNSHLLEFYVKSFSMNEWNAISTDLQTKNHDFGWNLALKSCTNSVKCQFQVLCDSKKVISRKIKMTEILFNGKFIPKNSVKMAVFDICYPLKFKKVISRKIYMREKKLNFHNVRIVVHTVYNTCFNCQKVSRENTFLSRNNC